MESAHFRDGDVVGQVYFLCRPKYPWSVKEGSVALSRRRRFIPLLRVSCDEDAAESAFTRRIASRVVGKAYFLEAFNK
jgi:hypothetical protein